MSRVYRANKHIIVSVKTLKKERGGKRRENSPKLNGVAPDHVLYRTKMYMHALTDCTYDFTLHCSHQSRDRPATLMYKQDVDRTDRRERQVRQLPFAHGQ